MNYSMKIVMQRFLISIGLLCGIVPGVVLANDTPIVGAVYAMTNQADGNAVVVYDRSSSGVLNFSHTYPTGGLGTGGDAPFEAVDALGSQNPLILSKNRRLLFAVNAISNTISVFRVRRLNNTLRLLHTVDSGGEFPVSLTQHGNLLYVLNSAGDASINGFLIEDNGHLTAISGSTRSLNAGGDNPPFFLVSPAQIEFDNFGERLAVTVKGSNSVHVFSIDEHGLPTTASVISTTAGSTPFGFRFSRQGHLLIAEAFGSGDVGDPNSSAVSSYHILADNSLQVISSSVANFQTASCWLETNRRSRFAYTTNNASDSISGYSVAANGSLSLINHDGISALTGHAPVDLGLSRNGKFLYAVNAGSGTVSMYRVNKRNGHLHSLGEVTGLPVENGAVGIAIR